MIKLIFRTIINVVILLGLSQILENFNINGIWSAVLFLIILTLLNWTVVPVIKFFALPLNFLTFGILYLIINIASIFVAANLTSGIEIKGEGFEKYFIALIISVFLALGNGLVNTFFKVDSK